MIILLGSNGYVGSVFAKKLSELGMPWVAIRSAELDLADTNAIRSALETHRAKFVINSAGFTGKPNVDACEYQKRACLIGNTVIPASISEACKALGISWGHVSSGCIFTGRRADGLPFTEDDAPNFSFRQNNCSFYSGTKALGEELLAGDDNCYIWRLRIPFDEYSTPRNYLQKVLSYERLLQAENSLSNLDEFVIACIDCWRKKLPHGIYNLTNPGSVFTTDVVEMIKRSGISNKEFRFFETEEDFMRMAAKTPRSNCVLDSSKALSAGLQLTPIRESIERCLAKWTINKAR